MNLVNLSTAVHRLAKLTSNDFKAQAELRQHPALEELLKAISAAFSCLDASEAQPQSLSNVAWSLATMRLVNIQLIQVVASLAVTNIACFKPFELSTMLWAFAKLGTVDAAAWCMKPVFQAAAAHIMKQVEHFGFRCLATTAWAFATARQRHARLFRCIAAQMIPMVHAANCQEMANTAWAFGTADFHDDQLFSELAEKATLKLNEFKPQELSNMLWGFATNGFFHEEFYTNASLLAQRMDLQAQHLANILWAFARVRPRHQVTQSTTLALLPFCVVQLETFKPQEVSSTALAVAKAFGCSEELDRGGVPRHGVPPVMPLQVREFFGAVTPWVIPRLREFSAQSLANTVSAYAMVHVVGAGPLFAAVGTEVLRRYKSMEPTALLHLLKGFSTAPQEASGRVVQTLAAALARHVEELRPQELQTLSRICAGALGLRQGRDLTCAELRGHCLALGAGEGGPSPLPPTPDLDGPISALPSAQKLPGQLVAHKDLSSWPPPPPPLRVSGLEGARASLAMTASCPEDPPCVRVPLCPATLAAVCNEELPCQVGCPMAPPADPPPRIQPEMLGSPLRAGRSSGLMDHGLRMPPPLPLPVHAGFQHIPRAKPGPPVPAIIDPWVLEGCEQDIISDVLEASSLAVLAVPTLDLDGLPLPLGALAHHHVAAVGDWPLAPEVLPPHLAGHEMLRSPPLAAPLPKFAVARSLPLMTVQELVPVLDPDDQSSRFFDQQQQQVQRRAAATRVVGTRWPVPSTAASHNHNHNHNDHQWRCSVKNSFLHVEFSDNGSDEDRDEDGGSSQRSSSVPSRLDRGDRVESGSSEQPTQEVQRLSTSSARSIECAGGLEDWNRLHPDLELLDFNWGSAQTRGRPTSRDRPTSRGRPTSRR